MSQLPGTSVAQSGKPKLLDQVRHRCRVRHLAYSTEQAYVNWIRRFIFFHHVRHPLEMGAQEVGDFLTHLAVEGHVAASTQNQALSALLFLYREVLDREFGWLDDVVRAKKPKRLPVVYTPEEAMGIIEELQEVRRLMGMLLYGGGLRLMECHRLRVKDLEFDRLQVTVREGKGDKDRMTLLAEAAVEPLKRHLDEVRSAQLCHALAGRRRRYPNGSGTARPRRRANDADLHARAAAECVCRQKSGGSVLDVGPAASAGRGLGDGRKATSAFASASQ